MSLGIAFKGPEGIVLAADSRVTLTGQLAGQNLLLPATYDNATKLLHVAGQQYVGVVTYGVGAFGQPEPRTAQSFLPEFEAALGKEEPGRLAVADFARRLGTFFVERWDESVPPGYQGPDMVFLVAGFDEDAAYGRVFELGVPSHPDPHEHYAARGEFGVVYGGQREFVDRLIQGFDDTLMAKIKDRFSLDDADADVVRDELRAVGNAPIPYPFLPLQDCVDLAVFCIETTVAMQSWYIGIRGVGGAVDVATITRPDGIVAVQQKAVTASRLRPEGGRRWTN